RPGVDLVAVHAPQLAASRGIERHDERLPAFLIPDDDEAVAVEDGRAALAELIAHPLVAEILVPQQRAVHVVDVHALRLEPGVDATAVGDRGARRVGAVVLMTRFVRTLLARGALPDRLAGPAIDREHDEA